jgi:hypothetical protein
VIVDGERGEANRNRAGDWQDVVDDFILDTSPLFPLSLLP